MDLISPCASWYICDISSYLYKMPCLWVDRLIFVLSYSFCCKLARVTLGALSPYPFGSTSKGFAFIGNLAQTLNHLIILLMNASWSSITTINNILYLISHFSILGILGTTKKLGIFLLASLFKKYPIWTCVKKTTQSFWTSWFQHVRYDWVGFFYWWCMDHLNGHFDLSNFCP
jgi:hypothetical protein